MVKQFEMLALIINRFYVFILIIPELIRVFFFFFESPQKKGNNLFYHSHNLPPYQLKLIIFIIRIIFFFKISVILGTSREKYCHVCRYVLYIVVQSSSFKMRPFKPGSWKGVVLTETAGKNHIFCLNNISTKNRNHKFRISKTNNLKWL